MIGIKTIRAREGRARLLKDVKEANGDKKELLGDRLLKASSYFKRYQSVELLDEELVLLELLELVDSDDEEDEEELLPWKLSSSKVPTLSGFELKTLKSKLLKLVDCDDDELPAWNSSSI